MSFHEVLFPLDVSLQSEGGPTRRTEIVSLVSGHEARNALWAGSRRSFNAGYGVRSIDDVEEIIAFFEARHGRLYGFRFRDPFDHKSCAPTGVPSPTDQVIGTGDGSQTVFALKKTYQSGPAIYERAISKSVAGSVLIAIDGTPLSESTDFSHDAATGTVSFIQAPSAGAAISAGYIFDTPVRFDTDELRINLAAIGAGDIPSIPLLEVLV